MDMALKFYFSAECLFEWKWTGSEKYPDGNLKVNCDDVVAWKTCKDPPGW